MTSNYQKQLNHIFDRPIAEEAWYWSPEEEPVWDESDPLAAFEFIEQLCLTAKTDLAPFSNDQIGVGLNYIFNYSQLVHDFKNADVTFERREKAVRSLFFVFRDVLNPRCAHKLGHKAQVSQSKINDFCYMFWDVCPLSTWLQFVDTEQMGLSFIASLSDSGLENLGLPESVVEMMKQQIVQLQTDFLTPKTIAENVQQQYQNIDAETRGYYAAIADVMQNCLGLSNPACVESGLHGLGHMATFLPDIAVPIIDTYLKNKKNKNKDLINYAKTARTGIIL